MSEQVIIPNCNFHQALNSALFLIPDCVQIIQMPSHRHAKKVPPDPIFFLESVELH